VQRRAYLGWMHGVKPLPRPTLKTVCGAAGSGKGSSSSSSRRSSVVDGLQQRRQQQPLSMEAKEGTHAQADSKQRQAGRAAARIGEYCGYVPDIGVCGVGAEKSSPCIRCRNPVLCCPPHKPTQKGYGRLLVTALFEVCNLTLHFANPVDRRRVYDSMSTVHQMVALSDLVLCALCLGDI
jgi:hypothetical protein